MIELEQFAFVLLRRGPRAGEYSEAELEALQAQHLAYLDEMTRRGKLVAAGPFSDQPDDTLRGLCFYATGVEEARRLAEEDPSVRAGRLAVDVMTWWTRKGSVSFHRA
jgi:uncharacterized protein YciI